MKQTKHKILSVFLSVCMIFSCMAGMSLTAYAGGGGTEVTQANVICQQYYYMDAGSYSGGGYDTPPVEITNITLANAQAFGAAVNCPTTYWVVVYAKDGDNLKWTSNGKTGEQTSTPYRTFSAWCELYNNDVFRLNGSCNPNEDVTFYFSKGLATVPVTGVSLDKSSLELEVDGTETLTATVSPAEATDKTVTWSSDKPAVATVSDTGVVTAVAAGTATITVTATNGTDVTSDDKTATCSVTVKAATVAVTGVTLDKTTTSIEVGKTETLTATVKPNDATDKAVTWSSDKPAVATVDENGKITAVAEGNATITVTTTDGKKTATCDVTVKAAADPEQSNTTPSRTPSYIPTYTPSATTTTTTTTTTETKTEETASFEGETTKNNTDALSWSGIKDAKSYTISVEVDGKYVELATTTSTTVDVIHAANGNYYVSENGKYTKYVYEDGKFVKDGTISVSKAEKLTKANDVTDDYMLQYTDAEGKTSTVENALFTSVTTYYKPAVKTKVSGDTAKLSWKKVTGATRYALYQVKSDGTLKLLKKTKNAKLNIIDLKSGKTYKFAVRALVDGKWTSVKTSDVVKVKVK